MTVDKLSISLEASLAAEVRESARRSGVGISSWLSDAAAAHLRAKALDEFLEEWQADHGRITDDELSHARGRLGLGLTGDRS
ncbi:hypothetical protein BH24CHL9_BH24CHL9_13300 [soil metagenome]